MTIVQHPREAFHPLNTVRIAEFSLSKVKVVRAPLDRLEEAFRQAECHEDAAIVYPSADSVDVESLDESERPSEIILLDGTWHHAKALLRDVPALGRYRRIRFTPSAPSEYRIRKEPKADYLSTIESIAYLLRVLEPETEGVDRLLQAFRRMIDRNVAARKPGEMGTRFVSRVGSRPHRFPEALNAPASHLLVAYCEGTSRMAQRPDMAGQQESPLTAKEPLVVHFQRLDGSLCRKWILKTQTKAPERLLEKLAYSQSEIESQAIEPEEAVRQMQALVRERDVVVAWNASSLAILKEVGLLLPETLLLKGVFCDWQNFLSQKGAVRAPDLEESKSVPVVEEGKHDRGGWGGMSAIIEKHAIAWKQPEERGRGPYRLAQTLAILEWMRTEELSQR